MKVSERTVSACWLGLFLAASAPAFSSNADAIYFGGPIVTVDDKNPSAEAVAVKAGKIVAVGSRTAVESAQKSIYRADQTKVSGDSALCVESSRCSEGFVAYSAHSPLATVFGIPPHMH